MTLLDEVRRFLLEDARRRATDAKPLYATAGAVDAAVGFLRGLPVRLETAADRARVEWTPDRFVEVFTDLVDDARDAADDAARRFERQRARVTDPASFVDVAREAAEQVLADARRAPGRIVVGVAEQAGAAFEVYDDLADRGRAVVARLRGDAVPGETATSGAPGGSPVFRRPTSPTAPSRPDSPPPATPDELHASAADLLARATVPTEPVVEAAGGEPAGPVPGDPTPSRTAPGSTTGHDTAATGGPEAPAGAAPLIRRPVAGHATSEPDGPGRAAPNAAAHRPVTDHLQTAAEGTEPPPGGVDPGPPVEADPPNAARRPGTPRGPSGT